jgi:hypothetical protein
MPRESRCRNSLSGPASSTAGPRVEPVLATKNWTGPKILQLRPLPPLEPLRVLPEARNLKQIALPALTPNAAIRQGWSLGNFGLIR